MARILIVDDEKENREGLRLFFGDQNPTWQIFTAKDEEEGLRLLRHQIEKSEPVDVLLTDLLMTDEQSGMNLLKDARKIDPQIMAILFTAKEKSLDRYAAFDFGAFDVVEKNIRGAAAHRELNIKARAALRYREWSQRINFLRRYFDPKVFETLEKDPTTLTLHSQTVTICFWDIRGFSKLCEVLKAHPTLISGFLQEYCDCAAKTVFDHGGVVDKFIGDGVMALFGVLSEKDDEGKSEAAAAVAAGVSLRSQFSEIAQKWTERWALYTPEKIEIGLGCGIHTGDALVGNVGTEFRDQFTALGPNVNFASRIEARSKGNQILISQSTEVRVRGKFTLSPNGEIDDIKNIAGVFKLFLVD